jgi:lysylphosphatidylglycerol synthetase-like protein (DUF2156 family)
VGGTPLSLPSERCSFGAERDGQLVGLASLAPIYARDGWLLEHLVRAPDAPNGTSELLVDAALRAALARQSRFVSLGLAPLAGEVAPWLGCLGRLGQGLYDFAGLARFKAKFRPGCWEPVYLAFPQRGSAAGALYDSLTAVAGQPLLRFGCGALASALQAR